MSKPVNLKPCPCGETPTELCIEEGDTGRWARASGNCCNEWNIEFRVNWTKVPDELTRLAVEAWNRTPRGVLADVCEAQQAEIQRYKKWFADNAAVLATHKIGGYQFK